MYVLYVYVADFFIFIVKILFSWIPERPTLLVKYYTNSTVTCCMNYRWLHCIGNKIEENFELCNKHGKYTTSFILMFSLQINLATNSAVKVFGRPDLLSPQLLQAGLNDQLYKIKSSLPRPEFNYFLLKGNVSSKAASSSSCKQTENSKRRWFS